jgi:chaperone BCS1
VLTFSSFINAIDGATAPTGRILFITTNHPEKLDDALMRPGRCDKKIGFSNADPDMAQQLFLRFFPGQDDKAKEFGLHIPFKVVSMADLQELLIQNRGSVDLALEAGRQLKVSHVQERLSDDN